MKKYLIIFLVNLFFVSYVSSQIDSLRSNLALTDYFDSELERFNNTKKDTSVLVEEFNNLNEYLVNNSIEYSKRALNLNGLNWYNIETKLLTPFKQGRVSIGSFLNILDTLDTNLLGFIPLHFQRYKYDQFEESDSLFHRVIELSKNYRQSKGFLIRATQRAEESKREIIDSIESISFYSQRHPEVDALLLKLAKLGDHEQATNLLELAIVRLPEGTRLRWFSPGEDTNIFEYLMANGSKTTKLRILDLIYKFLDKASTRAASQFGYILSQQDSKEMRSLIESKLIRVENIEPIESKIKAQNIFNENYLSHYARIYRTKAIPIIEKAMSLDPSLLVYEENSPNFRIKEYKDAVVVQQGLSALTVLSRLNDLSNREKSEIYNALLRSNLISARGYYWRGAIRIIQNLFPESHRDYINDFKDAPKSGRDKYYEEYWERRVFKSSNLSEYLSFFKSIGFDTSSVSKIERNDFERKYRKTDGVGIIWGVLDMLGISVNYDCETGLYPNPYDELIELYLEKSTALKDYYPIYKYKKRKETGLTNYTAIITNGKIGFSVSPKDLGDWYDPNSIEIMLNTCLKVIGADERYIQIDSGDQTVLTIYAQPGQVKKIVEQFGFRLINIY